MPSSTHSITNALALEESDHKLIVRKTQERYGPLLIKTARRRLSNDRRSSNAEDAVQEGFVALLKQLMSGRPFFPGKDNRNLLGKDIRNWLCDVVEKRAISLYRANNKHDGPSSCAGVDVDGEREDPAAALDQRAGLVRRELHPDVLAEMDVLQAKLDELGELVENHLPTLLEIERAIVSRWLDWESFRHIASVCEVTERDVRNTTFDFKTIPELRDKAHEIRGPLLEAIISHDLERVLRFYFVGRGLRLLVDLRKHA